MKLKRVLLILILLVSIAGAVGWHFKNMITGSSVIKDSVIFIPSSAEFEDVIETLQQCNCIKDQDHFIQVAKWKKYPDLVKPGRYELYAGMSNEQLINKLRIGDQDPVNVTFNNVRTMKQLAGRVSSYLEADSSQFAQEFLSKDVRKYYGFSEERFPAMFVPNTYEFNWNTSPEDFTKRMAAEFKKFWSEKRKQKASQLGLSQSEVVTLASIVEEETKKNDEKPIVAGVYLNRLKRGMLLQADPTVIFAVGDFSIRRVLNVHKEVESPYNTYKYKGLPPGPIRIPEISSIDAVLNFSKHSYLYFCAKEDFSGYHNFASNYNQHLQNARRYQAALNQRKIYQ